jgi:hypothetical protein
MGGREGGRGGGISGRTHRGRGGGSRVGKGGGRGREVGREGWEQMDMGEEIRQARAHEHASALWSPMCSCLHRLGVEPKGFSGSKLQLMTYNIHVILWPCSLSLLNPRMEASKMVLVRLESSHFTHGVRPRTFFKRPTRKYGSPKA